MDITLDPWRIQSESFLGICSSLAEMLSARGGSLPTLHTTLDSGISPDACKGLTKQGTNHLHKMETASLFGLLSDTSWMFGRVVLRQQKGTAQMLSPCNSMPTPNASIAVCFKGQQTSLEAQSVPQLFPFSLGTKMPVCHHPQKDGFVFLC